VPSVVRLLALLSVCSFIVLTLRALPDRAECMAPDVIFQRTWIVAAHVACTLSAMVASLVFSRTQPFAAFAFVLVAHVSASRALERIELTYPSDDRAHAVHVHGPWGLLRTHAGEGTELLARFRFAR
jgi:hypothetical protein